MINNKHLSGIQTEVFKLSCLSTLSEFSIPLSPEIYTIGWLGIFTGFLQMAIRYWVRQSPPTDFFLPFLFYFYFFLFNRLYYPLRLLYRVLTESFTKTSERCNTGLYVPTSRIKLCIFYMGLTECRRKAEQVKRQAEVRE